MATMASIFHRLTGSRAANRAGQSEVAARAAASIAGCRLRPLPNEDVYFFVKRIDNSRVLRQADPAAAGRCWRLAMAGVATAAVIVCVLAPNVYGLLAGRQIEALRAEQQKLKTERVALDLVEARLLSPERLQELAGKRDFVNPDPARVVYLQPKEDGSLALNVEKK
jgi:hypothetical protein